jgi:3-ketosteroid 9alpha-monooxygenase subunit A
MNGFSGHIQSSSLITSNQFNGAGRDQVERVGASAVRGDDRGRSTTMARDFPFAPFPTGWFQVAWGHEIAVGEVQALRYFGQDLVMFRSEAGAVSVLDAYCPHLGAHLGYGGTVEGEVIRCPFHAWKFNGDGTCAEIPYAKKISKLATVRQWPTREINGLIMVWHHADGDAPQWQVPHVPEVEDDNWTDFKTRRWQIKTRNQEMAENAVDSAHFRYLHGTQNLPASTAESEGHVLHVQSPTVSRAHGMNVEGDIDVHCHGFGFTTTRFRGIVETLLVSSATAIEDELIDVRFSFLVKKVGGASVTEGIGKAYIREIERQLEQDIPIWENKIYLDRPVLCDGDGPIGKFRKWAKQFYV